jgi:hypothetical protein
VRGAPALVLAGGSTAIVVPSIFDLQLGRDMAVEVARGAMKQADDLEALVADTIRGKWSGTLDYRDDTTDARVTLPTTLSVQQKRLTWVYDDGPGQVIFPFRASAHSLVRSTETWSVDNAKRSLAIKDSGSSKTWKVVAAFSDAQSTLLALDGEMLENDRPVFARKIITRSANRLRISLMTRIAGEPFLMRHSCHLTRAD